MTLGPDDLVLCSGTLPREVSFRDRVDAAVAGGFTGISLWGRDYWRARGDGLSDADIRALLDDNGLGVAEIDPAWWWLPGGEEISIPASADTEEVFRYGEDELFRIADAVGARSLNAVDVFGGDWDLDMAAGSFAALCDRAAQHGLVVHLEFLPWSKIPDLTSAWEVVRRAGRANGGVAVDAWHWFRGGGDIELLRSLPGDRVLGIQLDDGPAEPEANLLEATLHERRLPGEGEFDLAGLLRAFDEIGAVAPVGVEVFSDALHALPPAPCFDTRFLMPEVQGVVARSKGAPVSIETVVVPDPGPGEALVRVQACGVCHTDLHYREGGINDDFPFLLGHEAAGIVEEVGPDVTGVSPGDFVVLNWRAVCGTCRACRRGEPQYCFATFNASQPMTLTDGTKLSPALGIGAFAERTLVAAGQCTPVDAKASPAVAGLLGCGVMAGIGAAMHTGNVRRGSSVAVFGCGGVGNGAIAGAVLAGATTIVAVDIDDRKLEWARDFGATHTVNPVHHDPVAAVQEATGGLGADVCIEAVGHPEVLRQAFYARDLAGTVVQVGVPTPDMRFPDIPMIDFFGRGGALKPSWYGDCLPSRDFPLLIDLYLQGRLDLDRFVSETITLDGVEGAFDRMEKGEVLRSVVLFE